MESDRKYRQRGYMEYDRESRDSGRKREEGRRWGPRPPLDITGPRLPRMVQAVTAARCYNCATALPESTDFKGNCPRCGVALHCCKQCAYFEPSTRFQCLKPIPQRIPVKDQANECTWFSPRVTVAREATSAPISPLTGPAPKTPTDARAAFDSLFKK